MSSDSELIQDTLAGNCDAFGELVKKYESMVAATVKGMLGECAEAEDIGQETFIRLYLSLSKFRCESSLRTYVTRIAINLSLNELKRRRRRQSLFSGSSDELQRIAGRGETPEQDEMREAVRSAVNALEPKFRAVLVLRLMQGYSIKETAEILKLPAGTVMSRLARALQKLQQILVYERE